MQVKAKANYIRISPRKARLVAAVVRSLDLQRAFDQLAMLNKKAVRPIVKLLKSALANAEHNFELDKGNLFVQEIRVDDGPTLHRWMPRAFGRATPIRKRTSMISLILAERVPSEGKAKTKKQKIETIKTAAEIATKPNETKIETPKNDAVMKDAEAGHQEEYFDVKKQGGYRDAQQVGKNIKKEKGLFKKMFRRKSGM